ncbi:MAG TPA: S41 family peptidase [Terriglobales bacterium]|jgi:carboxyl-terminal processing protease|nr:S41 family peptidase [Terriglobales bacterium]
MNSRCARTRAAISIFLCVFSVTVAWPQKITGIQRDEVQSMLREIASDVKKHYYDPTLHGVDWDRNVLEAKTRIDQANDLGQALAEIAALLDSLKDSHTFFIPPERLNRYDYGWKAQTIGTHCYVTHVHPGSDAEAKGIKPGDEILAVNGYAPTKQNLTRMEYLLNVLRPQPALHLQLRAPGAQARVIDVATKIIEGNQARDPRDDLQYKEHWIDTTKLQRKVRFADTGDKLLILQFGEFLYTAAEIESMIGKARKHSALIIDLRGNGGGATEVLTLLLGRMFDHDVKIADRVGRDARSSMIAKGPSPKFEGKLIVLVDSRSASAAELFARVVQIEKRGVVLGDVSSGRVMEAIRYPYRSGLEKVFFYGASITDADLIMTDGKSLEHVGVTPDEVILPTANDLAAGNDPVLARAAEMLGVTLSPESAGQLFPYEWPPQ